MSTSKKITIKISDILIFLCIIFWVFPHALDILLQNIILYINVCKCACWLICLIDAILKRVRLSNFTIVLHLSFLVFLACILISDPTSSNVNSWLSIACPVCGVSLLFDCYSAKRVISIAFRYMFFLIAINFILLLTVPDGFVYYKSASDGLNKFASHSNFISTDNNFIPFLISFLLFGEIYFTFIKNNKYLYTIMWIISWLSMLLIFSATGLIGLTVFSFLIFYNKILKNRNLIRVRHIIVLSLLLFIGLYFFNIQRFFSILIVNILGKDLTLTLRTGLWSNAIDLIAQKPFWGHGNYRYGSIILRDYYYWYSHNLILDILLQGGMVTLAGFGMMIFSFTKKIKAFINKHSIQLVLYALVALAIVNITESYFSCIYFYFPFILGVFIFQTAGKNHRL